MKYTAEIDSLIKENFKLTKSIYDVGFDFIAKQKSFVPNPMSSKDSIASKEKTLIKEYRDKIVAIAINITEKCGRLEQLAAEYCAARADEFGSDNDEKVPGLRSQCVMTQEEIAYVRSAGVNAVLWVMYVLRPNISTPVDTIDSFIRTPPIPKSQLS